MYFSDSKAIGMLHRLVKGEYGYKRLSRVFDTSRIEGTTNEQWTRQQEIIKRLDGELKVKENELYDLVKNNPEFERLITEIDELIKAGKQEVKEVVQALHDERKFARDYVGMAKQLAGKKGEWSWLVKEFAGMSLEQIRQSLEDDPAVFVYKKQGSWTGFEVVSSHVQATEYIPIKPETVHDMMTGQWRARTERWGGRGRAMGEQLYLLRISNRTSKYSSDWSEYFRAGYDKIRVVRNSKILAQLRRNS